MGDSGSLSIGFLISILSIYSLRYINPTIILFVSAVPIIDTLIAVFRRKMNHRPIFEADKNHTHHILFRRTKSVKKAVLILFFTQVIFSIIGIFLIGYSDLMILLLFFVILSLFYKFLDIKRYSV
jgi:UDP-GlcNAc:undecaprenyl-phosphate GlcNAc-1-phosphate transferase